MPTRGEQIAQALDVFLQGCSDVEGAAVVSVDGLPMASALPMHVEEDRLAAMAAAMLSLGEKASEGLSRGRLQELHLEGAAGTIHLMSAGPQAVFCAICRDGAKTGLVLFEMTSAAEKIAAALAAPQTLLPPSPDPRLQPQPRVQTIAAQGAPAGDHAAPRPAARQPAPAPRQTPSPSPAPVPAPVPAPPEGTAATPSSVTTAPTPVPVPAPVPAPTPMTPVVG